MPETAQEGIYQQAIIDRMRRAHRTPVRWIVADVLICAGVALVVPFTIIPALAVGWWSHRRQVREKIQ